MTTPTESWVEEKHTSDSLLPTHAFLPASPRYLWPWDQCQGAAGGEGTHLPEQPLHTWRLYPSVRNKLA